LCNRGYSVRTDGYRNSRPDETPIVMSDLQPKKEDAPPRISVAAPVLDGRETEYVMECMQTSWISSVGRFVTAFEQGFANFCHVKHAVATNNGTTALHLALVALGIKPGDEVIVPSLTYIASANAVSYCAAKPVFVDNDPQTFNIDPVAVEAAVTDRTRAIMPVHLYGQTVDMDPLLELAQRRNLLIVEDAAEAVGARYKGRRAGALGNCATFSFFGNKILTTGEGGMVTTNDDALAARLRLLRGQGMDLQRRYWFPEIGYNYRMTNIAAAIGLGQLENIERHLQKRRDVAALYDEKLKPLNNLVMRPKTADYADHVYWMYTVMLSEQVTATRDEVMAAMDSHGVETRPIFYPMHVMPPYFDDTPNQFPNAEFCASRGINLPTHGRLTESDIDRVVDALKIAICG
jgi:perosamine synthetase